MSFTTTRLEMRDTHMSKCVRWLALWPRTQQPLG